MKDSAQVGQSIIAQAHFGCLLTLSLLGVILLTEGLTTALLLLSGAAGALCAAFLLLYWKGKGGIFFVLALICPLLLIIFAQLPTFLALAELVIGYFCALSVVLVIVGQYQKRA